MWDYGSDNKELTIQLALQLVCSACASSPPPSSSSAKKNTHTRKMVFLKKNDNCKRKGQQKWEKESANVVVVMMSTKQLTCFVLPTVSVSWWIVACWKRKNENGVDHEKVSMSKKVKLIWGKSEGLDPKFYKDLTVKFFSKKMCTYQAECQSDGIRADGNRYSCVHLFQFFHCDKKLTMIRIKFYYPQMENLMRILTIYYE